MANNVYQTKNYFIAAYHYVQCFGSEFVVPETTAEVAQAVAHYYKRAQVCACVLAQLLWLVLTHSGRSAWRELFVHSSWQLSHLRVTISMAADLPWLLSTMLTSSYTP